jgi:hypothetical protein
MSKEKIQNFVTKGMDVSSPKTPQAPKDFRLISTNLDELCILDDLNTIGYG